MSVLPAAKQPRSTTEAAIAATSPSSAMLGATFSAAGWLRATETWHCPPQSREESAGPEVFPCVLRQQLALLSLQQQGPSAEAAAKA
jgi:hypothetical protein